MIDLVTLGLRVENTQAVQGLNQYAAAGDRATASTNKLTATAEQSRQAWAKSGGDMGRFAQELQRLATQEEQATQRTNRFAQSLDRMRQSAQQSQANAMASMIQASDPFQKGAAALNAVEKASAGASKGLNALREPLTTLAVAATSLNPAVAGVASRLGVFAIGAPEIVAILAGIAAIGFAWDKLTEQSRKAKEEFQKQLEVLRQIKREQDLGITGEAGASVAAARARLEGLGAGINANQRLLNRGGLGQATAFVMQERDRMIREYTEIALLVQAGEKKVTEIKADAAEEQARKAKERTDKELAEIKRLHDAEMALLDLQSNLIEQRFGVDKGPPGLRTVESTGVVRGAAMDRIAGMQIPQSVFDSLGKLGDRAAQALIDAAKRLKESAEEQEKSALKGIAGNAGLSLLNTFGGQGGQLTSGVITSVMNGSAGGPWGAAISGATALVTGLFTMGRQAREASRQLEKTRDALRDMVGDFAAGGVGEIEAIARQADALREQIHAAYDEQIDDLRNLNVYTDEANKLTDERNKLLEQTAAAEKHAKEEAERHAEVEGEIHLKEITARLLRAQGLGAEADALEFAAKQQQEYEDAVRDGYSAIDLAILRVVQQAEAEARAAEIERQRTERLEDLNVRMAEALGVSEDQIDAMKTQIAHERELAQAQRDGANAAELARIKQVQQAEDVAKAINKAQGKIEALSATIGGLKDFENQLKLSDLAADDTMGKVHEAKRQYEEIALAALGGDTEAAGRLPGAAQTYLQFARDAFASSSKYTEAYDTVLLDTERVMKVFEDQRSVAQQQLDELLLIRASIQESEKALQAIELIERAQLPIEKRSVGFHGFGPADPSAFGSSSSNLTAEDLVTNTAATVAVLQDGLQQIVARLDELNERIDENTTVTRNNGEAAAVI